MKAARPRTLLAVFCASMCLACQSPTESPTGGDRIAQSFSGRILVTDSGGTSTDFKDTGTFTVSRTGSVDLTATLSVQTAVIQPTSTPVSDLLFGLGLVLVGGRSGAMYATDPVSAPQLTAHFESVPPGNYYVTVGLFPPNKPLVGPISIVVTGTISYP
jgi:hypothetical protein